MMRRLLFLMLSVIVLMPTTAQASLTNDVYAFTRSSYAGPGTSDLIVPVVVVPTGTDLYLFNLNAWGHSMYSVANGRDDRIFWSEEVPFGHSTLVNGVSKLQEGSYPFFCGVHPDMRGTLLIIDKEEI
ncbi:MAG: hypothetical protein ABIS18_05790 [Actinomycetota bacterium]